jgi:hypothetical protein
MPMSRGVSQKLNDVAFGGLKLNSTLATLRLALPCRARYFAVTQPRKEGRAMTTFFRHYRRRGPVDALQMRLQG